METWAYEQKCVMILKKDNNIIYKYYKYNIINYETLYNYIIY